MGWLIKCKIKLLNLQYFDASGHKFILLNKVIIVSRYGFIDLVGAVPGVRRCCPGIKWDNSNIHRS